MIAMLLGTTRESRTWRSHGGENQQRPLNDGLRRPFCWREGAQSTTTNDSGSYPHLVVDIRISTVPVKFSYAHAGPEETGGPMQTVLLCLLYWVSANLIIVTVRTMYCLWPRRRDAPDLLHSAFRRSL